MELIVNGERKRLDNARTVRELVLALGLGEKAVAVEVNQRVVSRRDHETTTLHDGDRVEIVTLVGGG